MKLIQIPMAIFLLSPIGVAGSDFVIAPPDRAAANGNSFIGSGFGAAGNFRAVYTGANFPGTPVVVTGVAFRLDDGRGGLSFDVFIPQLTLKLSTYAGTYELFPPTFVGPDVKTVFDGPITWHSVDGTGPAPNSFDLAVAFSQPFIYDPAMGSLVLSYWAPEVGGTAAADMDIRSDATFGWTAGDRATAQTMLIAQFQIMPVPEPRTFILIGFGTATLWLSSRKAKMGYEHS